MTQISFHRMTRNLFGGFLQRRLLTDFRRCDLFGRCRYPLRLDKAIRLRFHKKSVYICEICGTKFSSDFTDLRRLFYLPIVLPLFLFFFFFFLMPNRSFRPLKSFFMIRPKPWVFRLFLVKYRSLVWLYILTARLPLGKMR